MESNFKNIKKPRKDAIDPIERDENNINAVLLDLHKKGKIDEAMYKRLRSTGAQAPTINGRAKVHKPETPVRLIINGNVGPRENISKFLAESYKKVPECNINTNTKDIVNTLKTVNLKKGEKLVSVDVSDLFTNVDVDEAIEYCHDKLYALPIEDLPKVDRETLTILAKLVSKDITFKTHDGYYTQKIGLPAGLPQASFLANAWLDKYENDIRNGSKIFFRYMDDILKEEKEEEIERELERINNLHPNLKFTVEIEKNGELPFLDTKFIHNQTTGQISSTWYRKDTDTGLIMNFHSMAPRRYKRSLIGGLVHRIYRACSNWELFHQSLEDAKIILEKNQYPPTFYEPIIN